MVKIKLKRNNVAKNASSFSMKLIRLVLYTIGLLSLVVALFTAHQINSTYGSFDAKPFDATNDISKRRASVINQPFVSPAYDSRKTSAIDKQIVFSNIGVPVDSPRKKKSAKAAASTKGNKLPARKLIKTHVRLVDVGLANASVTKVSTGIDADKPQVVAAPNVQAAVASPNTSNENVLVVIISNRRDGIIPTLASIITTSSKPVDVVLIGEHKVNEEVRTHFGKRINDFKSLSVQDIEDDLVAQGFRPIWTWPDWHTSMSPGWKNENTLHVGPWDNLHTHAHELNHIRFYLPHVSVFKSKGYFYFLDDDLLVHKDLGELAEHTMENLDASRGLVCPCNIWTWNSDCFHFEFQSKKDYILSMPSLYGDREVCKTDSESHCVPSNYWDFVKSVMPAGGKDQHAWNFGFSLFALQNWRDLNLTAKYEAVMKESYRLHVFPETSLTFGLGVPYIAFAGAVECWDEDHVKVRDGFGFIEWDRFSKTFGEDFYQNVSVAHYTGPDKPWVHESRIEPRAIEPWLKMMEQENMPIPKQLPVDPTDNLFALLASDRTGAQWLMSVLDGHPQVCASGETDKPETGFPTDVLLPDGLPWYPYCSVKRGCTYDFVSKRVAELTSNMAQANAPVRCDADYNAVANNDPLAAHLRRLCNFVKKLDGNFDESNVARLWIDAFLHEDKSLLGCGCVRGVKAKGLKVFAEWILPKGFPFEQNGPALINLNDTKVHGNKIIRLKRRNLWARYKSMLMAVQTEMYHPASPGEKESQLKALVDITVDVEHMEWNMKHMEAIDRAGDEWANDHASDILWLDYEDCRADTADCFTRIYNFLGVDASHVTGKKASTYQSLFASFKNSDSTMDHIANRGEIKELLGINGWGHYIGGEKYVPIQFLRYAESDLLIDSRQHMGINVTLFHQDQAAEGRDAKYAAVLSLLRSMDEGTLVVLSSDREGRVNFPLGDHGTTYRFLYSFRKRFEDMTRHYPGAVIMSTDSVCCASALTHASPGDFFNDGGLRSKRSCSSGRPGCLWSGDDNARPWQSFMKDLASKRLQGSSENVYLDSSLIAGAAGDVARLIVASDVRTFEDDRAVFTDYMLRNPSLIILDYEQQIFGASRKPPMSMIEKKCFVADDVTSLIRRLDNVEAEKQPLFIFTPKDLGCGSTVENLIPNYPVWDNKGIVLKPILDHIDRVAEMKESIVLPPYYGRKPDYRQGPEVPYIIDDKGVWTSRLIRDRTNHETAYWRMIPTEGLTKVAHGVLMNEDMRSGRWNRLKTTVRSGGFPYWSWYGDFKTCNYKNYDADSIPIFTTCATANCTHAFPMPNYMTIIDSQTSDGNWRGVFKEFSDLYPWESKIRKVVWRGALSENEWRSALTSVRWRVAKIVHELNSTLFDVGLTSIPSWLTDKIDFDLSQVGGFLDGISPMSSFQRYIAVLDMDGNSWSSRFGSLLCFNSVVIKVEPKYFDYFYSELIPWTHYIPVKGDLSDLSENVAWALDLRNEPSVKNIITSANEWCSHRQIPSELAIDLLDIFETYVRLLDRENPNWPDEWKLVKGQLFSSPQLDLFQL